MLAPFFLLMTNKITRAHVALIYKLVTLHLHRSSYKGFASGLKLFFYSFTDKLSYPPQL